jgi:hypothetical protein
MDKILLGETRSEAISRVQERLGPATSRPLAEKTFWALAKKGVITMDPVDATYLIETDIEDSSIKDAAMKQLDQQSQTSHRRPGMRAFQANHNSMHKARVSTSWNPKAAYNSMKTVFAPDLQAAEGYQNLSVDDEDDQDN